MLKRHLFHPRGWNREKLQVKAELGRKVAANGPASVGIRKVLGSLLVRRFIEFENVSVFCSFCRRYGCSDCHPNIVSMEKRLARH